MTTLLSPSPIQHFEDSNGAPLSGGKLFTYAAGTTTKQATYTDSTGSTPNTNPVILNSRGEANIWLTPGLLYKFVLSPSTDTDPPTNPIWTVDQIDGVNDDSAFAGGSGANLIGYTPPFTSAVASTVYVKLQERVSVKDFGAKGDGITDDTASIQAAINWILSRGHLNTIQGAPAGDLYFPPGTYVVTSALNTGGSSLNNAGVFLVGAGRGASVIKGNVAGPVFELYNTGASCGASGLYITNSNAAGNNTGIGIRGNGHLITDCWFDALYGIVVESVNGIVTTDIQISDCLGDGCLQAFIAILNNATDGTASPHTITITNCEAFGSASNTSQFGFFVNCAASDISMSGIQVVTIGGVGIKLMAGCTVNLTAYSLNGFGSGSSPSTHRGIWVDASILLLGVGEISGWGEAGLNIVNGGTVIDSGAAIHGCVLSTGATNKVPVYVNTSGYVKSAGYVAGQGGGGHEIALIYAIGSSSGGSLSVANCNLGPSAAGAITTSNGGTAMPFAQITNNVMQGLNAAGIAGNTSIVLGALVAGQVSGNIISNTNAPTAAISYNSGAVNCTYNLAHGGTIPASSGGFVSVGNANF